MKVIVEYATEGEVVYKFDHKKAMKEFINYINEVQTMQGGIKKLTIEY